MTAKYSILVCISSILCLSAGQIHTTFTSYPQYKQVQKTAL